MLRASSFASPKDTVKTAVKAINDRNADTFNCFSSRVRSQTTRAEIEAFLAMADVCQMRLTLVSVEDVRIVGNEATATVTITFSGIDPDTGEWGNETDTDEMRFVREDGKWKIDEEI